MGGCGKEPAGLGGAEPGPQPRRPSARRPRARPLSPMLLFGLLLLTSALAGQRPGTRAESSLSSKLQLASTKEQNGECPRSVPCRAARAARRVRAGRTPARAPRSRSFLAACGWGSGRRAPAGQPECPRGRRRSADMLGALGGVRASALARPLVAGVLSSRTASRPESDTNASWHV